MSHLNNLCLIIRGEEQSRGKERRGEEMKRKERTERERVLSIKLIFKKQFEVDGKNLGPIVSIHPHHTADLSDDVKNNPRCSFMFLFCLFSLPFLLSLSLLSRHKISLLHD